MRVHRSCVLFWLTLVGLYMSSTIALSQTRAEIYQKINEVRVAHGKKPLVIDKKLARGAQSWAFFMPRKGKHNMNFMVRRTAFKGQWEREKIGGAEAWAISCDPVTDWLTSYRHAGIVLGPKAVRMGVGSWRGKVVLRTLIY